MKGKRAPSGARWLEIKKKWAEELRDVFFVTMLCTVLIFIYEFTWNQPRTIWKEASKIQPPPTLLHISHPRIDPLLIPPTTVGPRPKPAPAPASLEVVFYGKDDLRFWLLDNGDIAAEKPKFTFGLANMSHQFLADYDGKGAQVEPLPIPTKELDDYVRPHESLSTFIVLNNEARPFVRTGDRLLGQFQVVCMNCDRIRNYWVFWGVGIGGWYYEIPAGTPTNIPFIQTTGWSEAEIDRAADSLAPFNKRVSIFPDLATMKAATQRREASIR
jgi:hypothetical protein